ncbi:MAG TPA: metallophosphoesterase, partial [Abditibacteriaceae bacterium]
NELKPDVVVLTGDFVSRRNSYLPISGARIWAKPVMHYAEQVAELLKELEAPEGVFAVPGNHDNAGGNCDAISELLQASGVQMLVNQNTALRGGLALVGLDDLRAGRPNISEATAGIEEDAAQIILSHNPRLLPLLEQRNALVLAGHTHAGQVHLPLTNFRRRPSDMASSPYFQGWYVHGAARMYVNSGVGSVHFPMRFRCPPEIAVFTLHAISDEDV